MYTVEIPGGTADLLEATEMTPRRVRAMEVVQYQAPSLTDKLVRQNAEHTAAVAAEAAAAKAEGREPGTVPVPGMDDLTEHEADILLRMQDATLYAQLASWTLSIPRPETVDAVQDIPLDVYQALSAAVQAGKPAPAADPNSFEPNDVTVADDASPFPSSGSLEGASPTPPAQD